MAESSVLRAQIGPAGSRNHPSVGSTRETSLRFLAFTLLPGDLGSGNINIHLQISQKQPPWQLFQAATQGLLCSFQLTKPQGNFICLVCECVVCVCVCVCVCVYIYIYIRHMYFAMPLESKSQTSFDFSMHLLRFIIKVYFLHKS